MPVYIFQTPNIGPVLPLPSAANVKQKTEEKKEYRCVHAMVAKTHTKNAAAPSQVLSR